MLLFSAAIYSMSFSLNRIAITEGIPVFAFVFLARPWYRSGDVCCGGRHTTTTKPAAERSPLLSDARYLWDRRADNLTLFRRAQGSSRRHCSRPHPLTDHDLCFCRPLPDRPRPLASYCWDLVRSRRYLVGSPAWPKPAGAWNGTMAVDGFWCSPLLGVLQCVHSNSPSPRESADSAYLRRFRMRRHTNTAYHDGD